MEELLIFAVPPDEQLADLIEEAFLAGQINGQAADLGYLWLRGNRSDSDYLENH